MSSLIYIVWPAPGPSGGYGGYLLNELVRAFSTLGYNAVTLRLRSLTVEELSKIDKPAGLVFNNVAYPNVYEQLDKLIEWGVPSINNAYSQKMYTNKFLCYNKLIEDNIPVPKYNLHTGDVTRESVKGLLNSELQFPLVVKPIFGYFGSNIFLVNTETELYDKLKLIAEASGAAIIQECIKALEGVALSVYRVGTDISCLMRVGSPYTDNLFKSDIATGRIRVPYRPTQELYDLSSSIMQSLDVDVAIMDILLGDNGYNVIDVNLPGSFEGIDRIFNKTCADDIARLLIGKINDIPS